MRPFDKPSAILVIAAALLAASCGSKNQFIYSGTLQAESAQIGSTIGGRVSAVYASDGDRVKSGRVLVRLDDRDQRATLASAQSQQAQAAAALADLQAGPRAAEIARAYAAEAQAKAALDKAALSEPQQLQVASENVRQAQASLAQAKAAQIQSEQSYIRATRLFEQGAISAQSHDDALASYRSAQAEAAAARARLTAAQADQTRAERASLPQDIIAAQRAYDAAVASRQLVVEGARPQQIEQARAALAAAKASVAAAQSRVDEMVVKAPADGIVDSLNLRAGDLVGPRVQVATVREFLDPYVRIYVAQQDLGKLNVGQRVSVRSDALGSQTFDATVEQIDQDAQFTPRDVQTADDRALLAYGVKIRVHDPGRKLHGGTTIEVGLQ